MPVSLIPQFNIDEIINQLKKDYAPLNHKHTGSDTPLIDFSQITLPAHGFIRSGQSSYNVGIGFYLGNDNGIHRFSIGNPAGNYLVWDGTNLSMSGALIAGELHIPDEDTTANSFHVQTNGDTFWGCTNTDFNTNNDNATAYVLKTGAAKFQSVTLDTNVIVADLQAGSALAIEYLLAGTITSKVITLAVTGGTGDVKIQAGKTDFDNTAAGFILGIDDSDSDRAKFYIGDATHYLNWTGSAVDVYGATLTAGTIIGSRIGTGAAGTFRMEMRETGAAPNPDALVWMNAANAVVAGLTCDVDGTLSLVSDDGIVLSAGGGKNVRINNILIPETTATFGLGSSDYKWTNLYLSNQLSVYGNSFIRNLYTTTHNTYDIGQTGTRWKNLYLSGNLVVTGNVDGVDVSGLATAYNTLATSYNTHTANASAHHSSTSNALTITPTKVNINTPATTTVALNVDGGIHVVTGSVDIRTQAGTLAWGGEICLHVSLTGGISSVITRKDFTPYTNDSYQLGYSDKRWSQIHGEEIYCTQQTADQHVTGDLHFKDLYRIDETEKFLRFWNKKNKLIMKLSQDGELWLKKGIRKF